MNHIINGTACPSHNYRRDEGAGGATVSVAGGTVTATIPLGSFTLPLPLRAHPEQHQHQNSHGHNEPVDYTGETTTVTSRRSAINRTAMMAFLTSINYSDDARRMRGDINHTGLDNLIACLLSGDLEIRRHCSAPKKTTEMESTSALDRLIKSDEGVTSYLPWVINRTLKISSPQPFPYRPGNRITGNTTGLAQNT